MAKPISERDQKQQLGNQKNERYLAELAELETAFETPVVSGELESWIESVHTAIQKIADQIREQFRVIHEQQFADIAEQDGELLGKLENLKKEDVELLAGFGALASFVAQLRAQVLTDEQNETELDQVHSALAEQGVAFVVRARTQETAIATWHSEAFLRDLGVGD